MVALFVLRCRICIGIGIGFQAILFVLLYGDVYVYVCGDVVYGDGSG